MTEQTDTQECLIDIDKWLMEYEAEEDKADPKYSIYYIPHYEKGGYND